MQYMVIVSNYLIDDHMKKFKQIKITLLVIVKDDHQIVLIYSKSNIKKVKVQK